MYVYMITYLGYEYGLNETFSTQMGGDINRIVLFRGSWTLQLLQKRGVFFNSKSTIVVEFIKTPDKPKYRRNIHVYSVYV